MFIPPKAYIGLGVAAVIVDQLSKVATLSLQTPYPFFFGQFFGTRNTLGSFSLPFPNWAIAAGAIVLIGFLAVYPGRMRLRQQRIVEFPIILIVSGGMSNLLDRLMRGYVVDIVTIGGLSMNIADIVLSTGVVIAVYYIVKK